MAVWSHFHGCWKIRNSGLRLNTFALTTMGLRNFGRMLFQAKEAAMNHEISTIASNSDTSDGAKAPTEKVTSIDEEQVRLAEVSGVTRIEAAQAVWGKNGNYILWAGLAMMMMIFELDNSTVYNYQNYATSSFEKLSLLATLSTASTIISAVMKPPIAKISDAIGRGETYIITTSCYVLSYILCASSKTFNVYAAGVVFYSIGQTGTQILDQVRDLSIH